MFSNSLKLGFLCFGVLASSPLLSEQNSLYMINKSTTGELNIEIKRVLSDRFSLRWSIFEASGTYKKPNQYLSLVANSYQQTNIFMVDVHPFDNRFRMSFGLVVKSHHWDINVSPDFHYQPEAIRIDIDKDRLRQEPIFNDHTIEIKPISFQGQYSLGETNVDIDIEFAGGQYEVEGLDIDRVESSYVINLPEIHIDERDVNINARLKFRRYSPYIGLGWGTHADFYKGVLFSADIGLIFHGKPRVDIDIGGNVMAVHERLNEYINRLTLEKEVEINEDVKDFQVMPHFSFSMQMRF